MHHVVFQWYPPAERIAYWNRFGMPAGGGTTGEEARILERIARLLALAESSNVNEAQAAMKGCPCPSMTRAIRDASRSPMAMADA